MYGYIYITTNLINNKKYIGQKKSSYFLKEEYLGSGKYLKRAVEKYGCENFKVELIEECNSKEELDEREKFWINKHNAVYSDEYYNLAFGGHSVQIVITEEHRKHLSESHKGKPWSQQRRENAPDFTGEKNPFYGHKHSEETIKRQKESRRKKYETDPEYRKRISEGQKGKHHSEETKKKMGISISKGKRGKVAFNNGDRVIYRNPDFQEDGWVRGDLPHSITFHRSKINKNG